MKKLKCAWLNIPRKIRVGINIIAIMFLVFAVYVLLECPAFTTEQKFRRMEKGEMVGPSHILASFDQMPALYSRFILAETAEGVVMFQCSESPWDEGRLTYREKTGPVTVVTIPYIGHGFYADRVIDLPVFVFHDCPGAVRAELDLEFGEGMDFYTEVHWTYGDYTATTTYEKTWHLESDQELGGFFRFDIHAEPEGEMIPDKDYEVWHPLTSEGQALEVFSHMMEPNDSYTYASIPAAVRFYDAVDNLIAEYELTIRSVTGERYAREGGSIP